MTQAKVKKINSGVQIIGDWGDICSSSRTMESVIERFSDRDQSVDDFNGWRPREKDTKKNIVAKTAKNACLEEKQIEKDFNGTESELEEAGKNLKKSINDLSKGRNPGKGLKDASKNIGKVIGVKSVGSLRKIERLIYEHLMLRFNPYYFNTEDFYVSLEKNKSINGDKRYILTLNNHNEKLRDELMKHLEKRVDN